MRIVVVRLSEAFEDLWQDLGRGLGVGIEIVAEGDAVAGWSDVAAVVLAAGGAEQDAHEWLRRHDWPADVPVLVAGADPGRRVASLAVRGGASDYLALPEDLEILNNTVAAAVERHRETQRREGADAGLAGGAFAGIVGESPAIRAVLERAARVLPRGDATVLIVGETGTGKELLARALHDGGPRRRAPFVPVNCAALPAALIESELFGHERGAFTDARVPKPGLFEVAHGGTLFLDEIGTLPLDVQAKLLRVLDDHQVRRIGGTKSRQVDIRLIAATNEDLPRAVGAGRFREDLYYRLNVITHVLPPLRERHNDALLIAERLLARLAAQHALPCPVLTPEVRSALIGYHWPGNVRELRNAVERALFLSPPGQLRLEELVPTTRAASLPAAGGSLPFPARLGAIMAAAARATLERCEGNRSAAARQLAISRRRLARLLHERTIHSTT